MREEYQAIIIAGLISGVIGGAWMWINRYEIKPVRIPESFRLRNRLTGQVELCAMIDANTTYKTDCGAELQRLRGIDQMRQENAAQEGPLFERTKYWPWGDKVHLDWKLIIAISGWLAALFMGVWTFPVK